MSIPISVGMELWTSLKMGSLPLEVMIEAETSPATIKRGVPEGFRYRTVSRCHESHTKKHLPSSDETNIRAVENYTPDFDIATTNRGWKTTFLWGWPIFRGYVKLPGSTS